MFKLDIFLQTNILYLNTTTLGSVFSVSWSKMISNIDGS